MQLTATLLAGASTASSAGCSGATPAPRSSTSCCRCSSSPLFGAIFSATRRDLDVIVPGIAGMSVMSTTFTALAFNIDVPARAGRAQAHPRHAAAGASSYFGGIALSAVTNTVIQIAVITIVAGKLFFGIALAAELARARRLRGRRRRLLRLARRRVLPRDPQLRVGPRLRQRGLPAGHLHLRLCSTTPPAAPGFLLDIAQILPLKHLIDGLSGAMVTGAGLSDNLGSLAVIGVWAVLGIVLAVRGFSWEGRRS